MHKGVRLHSVTPSEWCHGMFTAGEKAKPGGTARKGLQLKNRARVEC